jgi:fibronectin type III domain protein
MKAMIHRFAFCAPLTTIFLTKRLAFLCGVLAVVASDISFSGQNRVPSVSPFETGAAIHETWADPQAALQFPNASETPAEIETVSSAPPTRSSFMASWDNVAGATGYLLDVSTSESFTSYVDGYHDLEVGNVTGRVVTGLNPGTTYYYRVRPYTANGVSRYSETTMAATVPTTGLIIDATFDSSITGNPNVAAIEAMINRAISIYESLFSDPMRVRIRFRYATTGPDGTPLPAGLIARSNFGYYVVPWNTVVDAIRADATTSNDNVAIASLPGNALSANVLPSSANGRAVGGDSPPIMFANGTVGTGGPYDGIVTLKSSVPWQFSRPVTPGTFDAQRLTEHEIDEVMGFGSRLSLSLNDLRPQDLFSWSAPGVRNFTSSGTRYFSINSGFAHIVNFNHNPSGDFGDWLSTGCPQAHPYVQNAFGCTGQSSDVTATSPEGINLDVIGYDLVSPTGPPIVTTNPATFIASFSARLNGALNPHGLATTFHFRYGTTTNYGLTTAPQSRTGNTSRPVSANIFGLMANRVYHFRIVASNARGTRVGVDRTFTTRSPTGFPIVTTNPATNVASNSATLNGLVYPHGLTTTVRFQYGTTTSYGRTTAMQTRTGNTYRNIAANISALAAHTTYHFRIIATNSVGTRMGSDRTFTTP